MKLRILISIQILLCCGVSAYASQKDSLNFATLQTADSLYLNTGKDIFETMPSVHNGDRATVTVHQSDAIRKAMKLKRQQGHSGDGVSGFRIRIYFSNAQSAREESNTAAIRFSESFPDHSVYRSFVNPNFKVTVGDFRSRSEALRLLSVVKKDFPAAFIVRETISVSN